MSFSWNISRPLSISCSIYIHFIFFSVRTRFSSHSDKISKCQWQSYGLITISVFCTSSITMSNVLLFVFTVLLFVFTVKIKGEWMIVIISLSPFYYYSTLISIKSTWANKMDHWLRSLYQKGEGTRINQRNARYLRWKKCVTKWFHRAHDRVKRSDRKSFCQLFNINIREQNKYIRNNYGTKHNLFVFVEWGKFFFLFLGKRVPYTMNLILWTITRVMQLLHTV